LHVHHVPTFKLYVAHLPFFACGIAIENKAALACSDEDHNFFTHRFSFLV
jgi:hypothetical protein